MIDPPKKPLSDLKALCKLLFNVDVYPYQQRILKAILQDKKKKITIRSTTRAGKSFTIAMAAIIYAVFKDNVRIGIIAPTYEKTKPIMDYIANLLNSNPAFDEIVMLDVEALSKLERLRKEVSKKRITFKNGSLIEIKSVDLGKKGLGIMGFGYNFCIIDETAEISDEAYSKIYRMLVESPETTLLEIGNPWSLNHFYQHHHSEDWECIHIAWQDCVAAGRMTQEAVEDQRKELTEMEFKVLFDADFPEESEFAVFKNKWLEAASIQKESDWPEIGIGIDVARGGKDYTVFTVLGYNPETVEYGFLESKRLTVNDTMVVAGIAQELAEKYKDQKPHISIDTVGLGAGVYDRLKELKLSVHQFIAGKEPTQKRFFNYKADRVFGLAKVMEENRFFSLPKPSPYFLQLLQWQYEAQSDRRLRVIDPENKSPDFADSIVIAYDSISKSPDIVILKSKFSDLLG